MIYDRWMSYLADDTKLCKAVIPGAHNSGTAGMNAMACCQDGDLLKQFRYGVRQFCIRLDTDRHGTVVMAHGIMKGRPLSEYLTQIRAMLDTNDSEFLILDMREYYDQHFGPVTLHHGADKEAVDRLLSRYIAPQDFAFCDFDSIGDVTMGDLRRSGKRYILLNNAKTYEYSVSCDNIFPWDKKLYGEKTEDFVRDVTSMFDKYHTDGIYWFQTQETPNLGTDSGVVTPRVLDARLRPLFTRITDRIAATPSYLEQANVIAGDFMTLDHLKERAILALNVPKGNIIPGKETEFLEGLGDGK